jgi:hypothetical protein
MNRDPVRAEAKFAAFRTSVGRPWVAAGKRVSLMVPLFRTLSSEVLDSDLLSTFPVHGAWQLQ